MLAPNPSQHLESQPVSQRNPSRFHQSVKRSSPDGGVVCVGPGQVSGAGIATLQSLPAVPVGDATLIA
jgi:hypothetical protein